jgi:hypothetical protein
MLTRKPGTQHGVAFQMTANLVSGPKSKRHDLLKANAAGLRVRNPRARSLYISLVPNEWLLRWLVAWRAALWKHDRLDFVFMTVEIHLRGQTWTSTAKAELWRSPLVASASSDWILAVDWSRRRR